MNILRALFDGLKEDALAFLAGVWTSPTSSDQDVHLHAVALHHASAFLQAYIAAEAGIDFQTILPSLLVALQSQDKAQREAALTCIAHLRQLAERRLLTVYKFDIIYGESKSRPGIFFP
jgi:U3 small nucleolar RNA-associated protein 10